MLVNSLNNTAAYPVVRNRVSANAAPASLARDGFSGSAYLPSDPILTLGKNLPVGRASADWNQDSAQKPLTVADATFTYKDGSVVTVPDSYGVKKQLEKTQPGTLEQLTGGGHGSEDGRNMGFDVNDQGAPGLRVYDAPKGTKIFLDSVGPDGKRYTDDFGKLCEGKFDPRGDRRIDLRACNSGNIEHSTGKGVAPSTADVLPGLQVDGCSGTLLENGITGEEFPASPGAVRTYRTSPAEARPGSYSPFPGPRS